MPEKQDYNTKARQIILKYLEDKREGTVSAADILAHLEKNGLSVSHTTVYRYLNKLNAERKVLKFVEDETQVSVYQFIGTDKDCDEHIHIKCTVCGRLIHLDCGFMHDIKEHLYSSHGFELQCDGSILYGVCRECLQKNKIPYNVRHQ